MKETKPLIILGVLGSVIVAGWFLKSHKSDAASPTALLQRIEQRTETRQSRRLDDYPISVKKTFRVEPNHATAFKFVPPRDKVPGILSGEWKSVGKSAGIAGAKDDTLIAFKVIGPDKRIIEKRDHPVGGGFKFRIENLGQYTFVFDNSGIVRSSAREVQLNGTYQPD